MLSGRDFWSSHEGSGIRSLVLVDGPHGVRRQTGTADNLGFHEALPSTCFPTGSALGCSWDPALVGEVARALGREARALNVDVLLGPAINIKRSPLGGRNFEYLSEDPLLTGVLGTAYVHGVQSTGVGTCVKHFAANSQETDRLQVSAIISARALREIYLPAFERVVTQAAPTSVMSAYNAINGHFASENHWLLTELLRDEWGFDGLVVSDWGAIKDRVEALRAGLDLEMPGTGPAGADAIVAAVRDGRLDRELVEQSLARLSRLADRTAPDGAPIEVDLDAHHALARRAGAESIVLLRNEHQTLPLAAGTRVAVIGTFAADPQFQGGGSSHVNAARLDIPLDLLRDQLGTEAVTYAPGYSRDEDADPEALRADAVAAAQAADVALVFTGGYEIDQSEGFDRPDIDLPAGHVELIRAVAGAARRTVVVLCNGGVVSLEPWHDDVDAVLECFALGQGIGGSIADVLTGAVNPSGRLAESIPFKLSDNPSFLNWPGENLEVSYGEGVFVGYRYYTSAERAVRYPFGHGLSYTEFTQSDLQVEAAGEASAVARLTVRNDGDRAGAHVVQLYVAPAPSAVRRPVRELAAFAKVFLEPGEETTVELDLDRRAFAYWDEPGHRWWVQPGVYRIEAGRSSTVIDAVAAVTLAGDVERPKPLSLTSSVKEWFSHPVVGPALITSMMANATEEAKAASKENANLLRMVDSMPMGQFAKFPGVVLSDDTLAELVEVSVRAAEEPAPA